MPTGWQAITHNGRKIGSIQYRICMISMSRGDDCLFHGILRYLKNSNKKDVLEYRLCR